MMQLHDVLDLDLNKECQHLLMHINIKKINFHVFIGPVKVKLVYRIVDLVMMNLMLRMIGNHKLDPKSNNI
jgi:hypothetical protein